MSRTVMEKIIERARRANRRVLLPESDDPRVIEAAGIILAEKYADLVLLGDERAVRELAEKVGADIARAEIIDHLADPKRGEYVERLRQRRKHRGMTTDQADELLRRSVYYAGMMVGEGRVDGMVAGSNCRTSETVRSALFGVGCAEGYKTVGACSIVKTIVPEIGVDGWLLFADTGVLPEPSVEQLADIAIGAAEACRDLLDTEPVVAMLSFSSKGSARSPAVQRVVDAVELVRTRRSDIIVDGELQADAALIPHVARRKVEDSPVAGRANTLIFPELASGNISYKLVERLGKATALGPLLMGLARPVNDLSRGCKVDDIVKIVAITAAQAQQDQ